MKKTAIRTAAYFTVLTVIFAVIMLAMYAGGSEGVATDEVNMSALRTVLFLPFSVCFAIANTVIGCGKPGPVGRWLLHFLFTVLPGYFFIVRPAIGDAAGSQRLIGFVLVIIAYGISLTVIFIARRRLKKLREQEQEYR